MVTRYLSKVGYVCVSICKLVWGAATMGTLLLQILIVVTKIARARYIGAIDSVVAIIAYAIAKLAYTVV